MRIGVGCFPLKANIGGMKQYFFDLFEELLESDAENQYVFFHNEANLSELSQLKADRWREGAVQLKKAEAVVECLGGLDLYFAPLTMFKPRPLPLPTVVTIPDNQEVFFPRFFSEQQHFSREWHGRGSARMADRVITISEFSKKCIAEHYQLAADKISAIPLCANPLYYRAAEVAEAPAGPFPVGKFIFYPDNHWPHKNHEGLLKALQLLPDHLGISLVLTGHQIPGGFPILDKAAELGVAEKVFLAGYVSLEQLAWLYSHAELVVLPSLFEGFGIPLVEAMAAGCPVASSTAGSLPEIGGDAVEYFDPLKPEQIAQAIERIATEPGLRTSLIERGKKRAAGFSAGKVAQAHLEIFAQARRSHSRVAYFFNSRILSPLHDRKMKRQYPHLWPAPKPAKTKK